MAAVATIPAIPPPTTPVVDSSGFATQSWRQYWTNLGNGVGSTGGNIYVNPGTGTNTRLLDAALADYANVNDYLSSGDANYDGAFARALSDKGKVYVPRNPWLGGSAYTVTVPIALSDGQAIVGDGAGISVISSTTTNVAVIAIGSDIYNFSIRQLTVTHSGTPVAGGVGISQGQGLHDWINYGLMFDVVANNCYRGFDLGKAYYAAAQDCLAINSVECGWKFTSTGLAQVGVTSEPGPLQWYLTNCNSGSNGSDGYQWLSTATGAAFAVSISTGGMINCSSYANGGRGVAALGNAAGPLYAIRIEAGFYGQDAGDEIYLDTWANNHVIRPTYVELGGAVGIHLTGNGTTAGFQNSHTEIGVGIINGCGLEGIFSQAPKVNIVGGQILNNGLLGTSSRQNGIQIFSSGGSNPASGSIVGVQCTDTGAGVQKIGIASNVDGLLISACDVEGNITAPTALPTIVNTIITGCLPASINANSGGSLTVTTLSVTGLATVNDLYVVRSMGLTLTPDLVAGHFAGTPIAFTGASISMTGALAVTGNVQMQSLYATVSAGIGTAPTGTSGQTKTADLWVTNSMGLTAAPPGTAGHVAGSPIAFDGASINMTGTLAVTGNVQAQSLYATVSAGIGTSPTGTAGQIKASDAWITRSIGLTTAPDNVGGHIAGSPLAFTGASISMTGALAVTGNVQAQSLYATVSAGVGTAPSGTSGRLDAGGIVLNGAAGYATNNLAMTGTLYTGSLVASGSIAFSGSLYSAGATGGALGAGTINVQTSVNLNSSAYTNP